MFIYTIIKIKYVNEGYLPNYPYHMIADREMFDAFLQPDGYFETNYPLIDESMRDAYDTLCNAIKQEVQQAAEENSVLPSWVLSYMIGSATSVNSSEAAIDTLTDALGIDTCSQFNAELAEQCLSISTKWVQKLAGANYRPPTMFGEGHVYKSLRLTSVDVLN